MPLKGKNLVQIVNLLERLSLVDFADKRGVERLGEAIAFADQIKEVNTKGVKPMITVLEDMDLFLRDDRVEAVSREAIQRNSSKIVEDYFVAPPGNIPITAKTEGYADLQDTGRGIEKTDRKQRHQE